MRDDEKIYANPAWERRRHKAKRNREWYEGEPLLQTLDEKDHETDTYMRMFPMGINLAGLGIDLHTDLARGTLNHDERLVASSKVIRDEENPDEAEHLEAIINDGVWIPSHGGPLQYEALRSGNIYGAFGIQLMWEPWDPDLPHGLSVRLIKDPSEMHVVVDYRNPWRPLEVYIGYEISPEVAKAKYGITPENDTKPVLYLEHWTRKKWKVMVDGVVPKMKWPDGEMKMEMDNPWGFIPVYYVPHDRKIDFYGSGHIEDTEDIILEFNARAANISDLVHATRPGKLYATDISTSPSTVLIRDERGKVEGKLTNLGNTRPSPNANAPKIFPTPTENISDSLLGYPTTLFEYWMIMARVSPATFGLDDSQSGRITGTAVANRMWTSVSHAITERMYFTEALCQIAGDIIRMLREREKAKAYEGKSLTAPNLQDVKGFPQIKQEWSPMLLMDRTVEHEMQIEALREGGMSWERYLNTQSIEDVPGEIDMIKEKMEFEAEMEAKVATAQAEAREKQNAQSGNQGGTSGSTRKSTSKSTPAK